MGLSQGRDAVLRALGSARNLVVHRGGGTGRRPTAEGLSRSLGVDPSSEAMWQRKCHFVTPQPTSCDIFSKTTQRQCTFAAKLVVRCVVRALLYPRHDRKPAITRLHAPTPTPTRIPTSTRSHRCHRRRPRRHVGSLPRDRRSSRVAVTTLRKQDSGWSQAQFG